MIKQFHSGSSKTVFLTVLFSFLILSSLFSISLADSVKERWAKENASSLIPRHDDDPPIILNSGGPDAFGYFFYDSHDGAGNAPTYRWIGIADTLRDLRLDQDDEITWPLPIGFPFTFYGQTFTHLRVCSNGWISFSSVTADYLNRPMPTPDEPNNLIAVFWDDLVPQTGHAYRYSNGIRYMHNRLA